MFSYNGFPYKEGTHHRMVSEPIDCRSASEGNTDLMHYHQFNYVHDDPMDLNDSDTNIAVPLEVHLDEVADHLLGLLQREANDYSVPLPVRYYPTEFADETSAVNSGGKSTTIGPWRKRISSWMIDVVDHFKYDRNVVSIALRYIDQYVAYLLLRKSNSSEPVKRRHFQLIAVTSLYLAIKLHGELHQEDGVDFMVALLAEVDGYGYGGYPKTDDDESVESDDEIRALSDKIKDLRRRHRLGRMTAQRLEKKELHPIPFKPRKRGMLSGPLRLNSFVELSRGLFTFRDITDTESKILKALNYVVNPPTSRRFVGELMRMLGFTCNAIDGCVLGAGAYLAEKVGVDRHRILSDVFASSCHQIEGAASVPALSLGCLPSVVAYAAVLNAMEDAFSKQLGLVKGDTMTDDQEKQGSYDLEDFQRHYRRYSRSQSAPIAHHQAQYAVMNKDQYLEAWKEKYVMAVFQASNCFLAPDSGDICCVRELLLNEVSPLLSENQDAVSPTEEKSSDATSPTKKRSPRSPRSVMGMSQVRFSGSSSFFSRSSSSSVIQTPYERRSSLASTRRSDSFRSSSSTSQLSSGNLKRSYFKQASAPLASEHHSASFMNDMSQFPTRASTPEVPQWDYNEAGRATSEAGFDCWGSEAFQPPPFFSA